MANEQNLKPFKKGDKRINRKGRPKDFAGVRQLAQTIAHEDISDGMTVTEAILRKWAGSKDPRLQLQFMEVAFGKVPQPTENKHEGTFTHEIIVRRGKNIHRPNRTAPSTDESAEGSEAV